MQPSMVMKDEANYMKRTLSKIRSMVLALAMLLSAVCAMALPTTIEPTSAPLPLPARRLEEDENENLNELLRSVAGSRTIPLLQLADLQLVHPLGRVYNSDAPSNVESRLFVGLLATIKLREELLGESLNGDQQGVFGGKVLVKEATSPAANALAKQELKVYEYLLEHQGLLTPPSPPASTNWGSAPLQMPRPQKTGRAAAVSDVDGAMAHVSVLLAHVRAPKLVEGATFVENWHRIMGGEVPPPAAGNRWLIYRKEEQGLVTVAHFPRVSQWADGKLFALPLVRKRALLGRFVSERGVFVRTIAERSLRALSWLHSRNVLHRGIGGYSLLMSTTDQRRPHRLSVRLSNLGLATPVSQMGVEEIREALKSGLVDDPLDMFPQLAANDLKDLGYTLLKLVICAFSPGGVMPKAYGCTVEAQERGAPNDAECALQLQRTVERDHRNDLVGSFRPEMLRLVASAQVPAELIHALELLDMREQSGWWLLNDLIKAPLLNGLFSGESFLEYNKWFKGVSPKELVHASNRLSNRLRSVQMSMRHLIFPHLFISSLISSLISIRISMASQLG